MAIAVLPAEVSLSQPAAIAMSPGEPAAAATVADEPKVLEDWKRLLGGRFEVKRSAVIGRGAYAVVRRGRDLQEGKVNRMVAIKFYVEEGDDGTNGQHSQETLAIFKRSVGALQTLHAATAEETRERLCRAECVMLFKTGDRKTSFAAGEAAEAYFKDMRLDPADLFVQLEGFSRDCHGQPNVEGGMCYLATEFGLQTLDHYITDSREFDKPPSQVEVRDILSQLTQVVATLHAHGLVHLDIKPSNIMQFKRGKKKMWKLIDMDGVVPARSHIDPMTVPFTPVYCPPELACAVAENRPLITVSRWMDIWCIGMTVLDCILPKTLLQSRYRDAGHEPFLAWLGALSHLELPADVSVFDAELANLLSSHILCTQPCERLSILELLAALQAIISNTPVAAIAASSNLVGGQALLKTVEPEVHLPNLELQTSPTQELQEYSKKVFPSLVPLLKHLLVVEPDDLEKEAISFLELRIQRREWTC